MGDDGRGAKVNGSDVPLLDHYLEIPVGEAYKAISGSIPTAILVTFYVDEGMCITRDNDKNSSFLKGHSVSNVISFLLQ